MTSSFECPRCGAAFGITGEIDSDNTEADEGFNELVKWHEDKLCAPLARTPLERARLLVELQWDDEDADAPTDATATALLALAEEQRTANLIALLALPAAVKTKPLTEAKNRVTALIVERLELGGAS
jgi:hypothetical protein